MQLKFRDDRKPLIHISAERKRKEWVFSVSDNGIGIPTEHREKLRDISATAYQETISRHRHWSGDVQKNPRTAWRTHLGEVGDRERFDILLYNF